MTNLVESSTYWVEPELIRDISAQLVGGLNSGLPMHLVCEQVAPMIAHEIVLEGLENIPPEGPLVIIKNHPIHFDALTLGPMFARRPDLNWLLKKTINITSTDTPSLLVVDRSSGKIAASDAERVKRYLANGGSMLATPWGSLNHESADFATVERACQNARNYAQLGGATVVAATFDVEPISALALPVGKVKVSFGQPIYTINGMPDGEAIDTVVRSLYPTFT